MDCRSDRAYTGRTLKNHRTEIHAGYAAALAQLFQGGQIISADRLTGGVSADVYRLDLVLADNRRFSVVLRAHGVSHSGHGAQLEFDLLKALHGAGMAVPEPLLVDTSGDLVPESFLIMSFVEGSTHIPEGLEHERIESMAAVLAQIHTLSSEELPELPRRDEPWPELLDYLPDGRQWRALGQRLGELELPGFDNTPHLLHGDFWPENLLWKDGQITAVLDWEDSAIGDRHSDVATARVELRYLFGREIMDQFTQAYVRHLPIDRARLMFWQIYVAAAAQKYMGYWGLPKQREAHMRTQALASISEAADELMMR